MKFNREEIEEKKLKVLLQQGVSGKLRIIKFPESVDVEAGTVSMWSIPVVDKEELLKPKSLEEKLPAEPEYEEELDPVLQTQKGKVMIFDSEFNLVAETKDLSV